MFQYLAAFTIKANEIGVPTSTKNVGDGLTNIVQLMVAVVGMVSVIAIMVGGLFYAFSHGDAKLIQRAKDTLMYAVLGLILSIGAYAIVEVISNAAGGKGPN